MRLRLLLRGLLRLCAALGLAALFVVGAVAALVVHLDLPASRRAAASVLESALAGVFQGRISIGELTHVHTGSVEATDIVVRDSARRVVLKVTRLSAEADLLDILERVVRGDEKLTVVISHVRVERAEAAIIPDEEGLPTLASAFTPRPTPEAEQSAEPSRYVRVWLPQVEIGHAFARGSVSGSPTLETELSAVRGSVLATPKGAAIDVTRFALLARGALGGDAKGVASLHIRAPGAVWGTFDGYMGEVQFGSVVRYDQETLDLKVDAPRAEPQATRALFAEWPLLVPTEAKLRLFGKLPDLKVELDAKLGERSTLSTRGTLSTDGPRLQLEIEGRKLDLRALWPEAPQTSIDLDTDLSLQRVDGELVVGVGGSLAPTSVERVAIPAIEFSGATSDGSFTGEAKLHDLGLPVDVDFAVTASGEVSLHAEARRVDLAKVRRLAPYFSGAGNADLTLSAKVADGQLDSSVALDVRGLRYQDVALQQGRLTASVKGAVARPSQLALNARVVGQRLSAGRFAFQDVRLAAFGSLASPTVTAELKDPNGPSFDARARVHAGTPISVRGLSLGVSRAGVEIRGDVAQLDLSADRVLVRELRLHGATGELNGSAEIRPDALSVNARGQNLDLSAFSRVLGLPRGTLEGRASLAVDAIASGKTRRGTLELSVKDAAIANLNGISGELNASLADDRLTGSSAGRVEAVGSFSAEWDTVLAGAPTRRESFERAIGTATLSLTGVTLDYVGQLLPDSELDFGGEANATLKLSRSEPGAIPNLELTAETRGLRVTVPRAGGTPTVVAGIELLLSATHDGATGDTNVSLGAQQGSERLIATSTDINLDLAVAQQGREPLLKQLQQRPLLAKLVVSHLDLDALPDPLRVPGLRGTVRLEGGVRGSLDDPIVSLSVRAGDLRLMAGDRSEPIDACGTAEYAKQDGAFNVGAELFLPAGLAQSGAPCSGRRIAIVRVHGEAPLDFERGLPSWSGTALAELERLPLATIPALADSRVTGFASGTLQLDRSGGQPTALANLRVEELRVDRLTMGDAELELRSSGERARASFVVTRGTSRAEGVVNAGVSWKTELPALDDAQPIDIALQAQRMEASLLGPFLTDFVSELRGRIDGNVNARLAAVTPDSEAREVEQVTGDVQLQDGSFVLTGLGFRLREVAFKATATRDGKTTLVNVPNITASAGGGTRNMSANLSLRLLGFDIVSGTSKLNIVRLPLVVDGVTRANANAEAELILVRRPEKMLVDVIFTNLTATLPEEETRQLIELNENPNVTIVQPIAQPKSARKEDDLYWHFVVHLGREARIGRGSALDLRITGDPNVVLGEKLSVTGSIYLSRGGALVLYRKLFTIESGGVHFDTQDPADPRLDVQASYRSPDGETLFVYVTGTLSRPTVNFDRSRDAAMAVLLKDDASATNLGIGVLDSLLGDTPLGRVQLRSQESTDTGEGTIYSAQYRVSDKVIVEGNYRASSGSSPDDSDRAGYGAAVDWRVGRNVSVRGQLGTIGTGVELVYQYEY